MKTRLIDSKIIATHRSLVQIAALLPFLFTLACTSGKSDFNFNPAISSSNGALKAIDQSIDAKVLETPHTCAAEDLAMFDRQENQKIDQKFGQEVDLETLPRGLYLATVSDMLLEKQNGTGAPTRILIREIPGGKGGEVVCNENLEGFGHDFQISVTGLVKFDTTSNPQGADFTARQFYVFSEKNTQGIVLSHPTFSAPLELKKLIQGRNSVVHFVHLADKSYLMSFMRRKSGGVRARLLVHLELVSR